MAKWTFGFGNWTPTAVADATNFTDSGYQALQGGSSTQRINLLEVYIGGLASSSTPCPMVVARDSTVGATLTALSGTANNAANDPATAALAAPQQPFVASTTKPQRSASLKLLQLSVNAFGGIIRWVVAPDEDIRLLGNTASLGEVSLSCQTGGTPGAVSSHFCYETI